MEAINYTQPCAPEYHLKVVNPFFNDDLDVWFKDRGFELKELRLTHPGTIPDYEYVNDTTGLKISFVGNTISVSGRHKAYYPYPSDMWVKMWEFTNPVRTEIVKTILKAYKDSI